MVSWMAHLTRWKRMKHSGGAELAREDGMTQRALDEKFGPWKWLVGLGPVALVCMAGALYTAWPNGLTFRLLMGTIALMAADLVYTWCVVATYRAKWDKKEETHNGKTV